MELSNLNSSSDVRLKQILHTLESIHGIKLNAKVDDPSYDQELLECQKVYEQKRLSLIENSAFNSYLQDPEYIKSMLILEAVKIILTEIAPKRRRKKSVSEASNLTKTSASILANAASEAMKGHIYAAKKIISSMNINKGAKDKISQRLAKYGSNIKTNQDMSDFINDKFVPWATNVIDTHRVKESTDNMDENMKPTAPTSFSTQLKSIAAKVPPLSNEAIAFSNALSSIGEKLSHNKLSAAGLSDAEEEILNWMRSLPRPLNVQQMIADGVAKFGQDLFDKRMEHIKKFKARDQAVDENKDQDGDGDTDFADIMIARMRKSGMPKGKAIAKTHDKSYNKESVSLDENSHRTVNFNIEDIRALEAMNDFDDMKIFAKSLLSRPSRHPIRPEKVLYFMQRIDSATRPDQVVKMLYDMMLSGEGLSVFGSRHSTGRSEYRKRFDEQMTGDVMPPPETNSMPPTAANTMPPNSEKRFQAHHYEYQASMARSELYRNARYAMSMMKQVDPKGEVPPWIAGALTKAANYLDKIYHYLDYYKKFEPEKLPENMDGDVELGETSGGVTRQNLMMIMEYSIKLFEMIKPGDKLEGWVAMKLTTASECVSSCKHYMDYTQFENHGLDDHFAEARRAKMKIKEGHMLNEQEDLAKASTILAAKDMSSKVQGIAEDVAKMSVEDLMPLVDIMRGQFGPEAATAFNDVVKSTLEALLNQATKTKEELDTAVDTLNKGGVPSAASDIETAGDEEVSNDELGAEPEGDEELGAEPEGEESSDLDADLAALSGEETPEPLGRAKKSDIAEARMTYNKKTARMELDQTDPDQRHGLYNKDGKLIRATNNKEEAENLQKRDSKFKDCTIKKLIQEKAVSQAQQQAAAIALAVKNGKKPKSELKGASKEMYKMSKKELEKFAGTARKDLPKKVAEAKTGKCKECGAKFESSYSTCKEHKNKKVIKEEAIQRLKAKYFIAENLERYKKHYGDDGEKRLYMKAWHLYMPKSAEYKNAEKLILECKSNLNKLNERFQNHKTMFAKQLLEGVVSDPLKVGYGLEGTALLESMQKTKKILKSANKRLSRSMQEGVIGLLHTIDALNKVDQLQQTKLSTPYGVLYTAESGKRSKKLFETIAERNYWVDYHSHRISDVRYIGPESFDAAIKANLKG